MLTTIRATFYKTELSPSLISIILGIVGATLNRLLVLISYSNNLSSFQSSLMMETIIPFFCTFLFFFLSKKELSHCMKASVLSSLIGAFTTFMTFNWS